MFELTLNEIKSYYEKIKKMAFFSFQKENYVDAISKIDIASLIAYNLNWIYQDAEIELLLKNISRRILPDTNAPDNYIPIKGRFIFYDQIGNSTVLTLQYLYALMAENIHFMYVLDSGRHTKEDVILSELKNYPNAEIFILDKDICTRVSNIKEIYKTIIEFRAEKAFIHAPAEGAFGVILWNALSFITRYRIVPGDHHFYIGTSVSDYFIEFRTYGATVAIEKRGIDISKICFQQYYPIIPKVDFKSFPFTVPQGSVIMVSGGAFYKISGSNSTYYNILKELVSRYPQLIICYAGSGDKTEFVDFINENNLHNQIYLLGYRNDINELINHCDIYLGTYPIVGGLMSQYAAMNAKPILQYTSVDLPINDIEGIVSKDQNKNTIKTHTKLDSFFEYADKLICDQAFRKSEGEKIFESRVTEEVFRKDFRKFLNDDELNSPFWKPVEIDYDKLVNLYLEIESKQHNIERILAIYFKLKSFYLFPKVALKFITSKFFLKKIVRIK